MVHTRPFNAPASGAGNLGRVLAAGLLGSAIAAFPAHADLGQPGPFIAGWRLVTITRPNGTPFTARLFHPALAAGQDVPMDRSGAPYPAISFGHGFLQPVSRYQSTLEHLATHGFLVIASDSEGSLLPNHQNFANDLSLSLTFLEQVNTIPGTFLEGTLLSGVYGLCGHSMGGGAALLAAATDTRVDAVATLAAAETNPSSTAAAANIRAPLSLMAGSADTIVSATTTNAAMYSRARAPKQSPVIVGGWHCGFEDVSGFGCDSGPMTRNEQLLRTRRLLTEWFTLYLKGDQTSWRAVWGPESTGDAQVNREGDPGIAISPLNAVVDATHERTLTLRVLLTNSGPSARVLRPFIEASGPGSGVPIGWTIDAPATGLLAPGTSGEVDLRLTPGPGSAYEQASLLLTVRSEADLGTREWTTLTVRVFCPSDFNRDQGVDFFDYLDFSEAFATDEPSADFNADASVDFFDYLDFVARFGAGC